LAEFVSTPRLSPEDDFAEQPAIEWLGELGWSHVYGPDIAPDGPAPERESFRDVILADRLRGFLKGRYPKIPAEDLDLVISGIQTTTSPTPIVDHGDFHRLLIEGYPLTYNDPEGIERTERIQLVDFDEPLKKNDLIVVNQMTIVVDGKNRRPDLLLFVNGIPLGQIEVKSPTGFKATPERAVHQVEHYVETIPPLYRFVEIIGVSDLIKARVGTITTPAEHFAQWKSMDRVEDEGRSELEVMIRGVFAPRSFLTLLSDFVLFESDSSKVTKVLAKYHQVDAVEKAVEATAEAMDTDGRAGVVWHTQGSGKSYSMLFYTQIMRRDPRFRNPTIVAVTDRINLDNQLMQTFAMQAVLAPAVEQAESVDDLRAKLQRVAGGVIFTVINKFRPPTGEDEMPIISERDNIIVLSDEAHRSQYETFAANLHKALPNAVRIGFTGTPIEKTDRSTRTTFGEYISVYDIARAVEDGATVPIYYENRAIPLEISDAEKVAEVEALLADESEESADKVVRRETRLEKIGGSDDRLDKLAEDIHAHFTDRQKVLEGKGLAVEMNRRIAAEVTNRLKEKMGDEAVTCVITASADEQGLNKYRRSKHEMEQVAKDFKDPEHPLKFVVVCDMWLTGFDAPALHTMYIDKPMRDHGLLQAIARVNRVFRDKPGGLVVDYIGIGEDLRKALPGYSADDVEEAMVPLAQILSKLKEKHDVVKDFFHGLDYSDRFSKSPAQQATLLAQAHAVISADEEETKRFLREQAAFAKLFALAFTTPTAQGMVEDAGFFADVARSVRKYTAPEGEASDETKQAVKQFFSEGLAAGEVVDIFGLSGDERPEISVLSDEFLDSLEDRISQPDLQVALLRKLLRGEIKVRGGANKMQAKLFGDQLDDALKKYANRQLTSAEVVSRLVRLAKQMREARRRHEKLGLSSEEAAFYDALAGSPEDLTADPQIAQIAKELVSGIRGDLAVDWTSRESREAAIRRKIKRLLRKHKYKPSQPKASGGGSRRRAPSSLDETTDLILEQAREIYRTWPDLPYDSAFARTE
jgi:type I restriction enzyme R subunit